MTGDTVTVTARDGTRLAVHRRGAGAPLLCVPGGPGRAASYLENLAGLDAERLLLLLDNRGSGASELPADRESLQLTRLPDDVEDVCAALRLEPVDVLGHSAGCPVALLHAARYPGRVRSLVLVTPSGRPFGWTPEDLDGIRAARSEEPWYAEAAQAQAALEHANPRLRSQLERETRPFWYGRWDGRAQAHAAAADHEVSLRAATGYAPGPGYDPEATRESLRAVRARTLVVVGDRDALTGASVGARFVDLLPDAELAVVPSAGHFPWIDEPAAFRATVAAFLAR
ncbi:MAG TPA: alpha/beta hydrolase [Mycobacteriales bacterium]|nr:alpha/beta hydrolase [Mycobacteriales bacterium]